MGEFDPIPAQPGGIDDWAPKRTLTLAAARAHSRRVRIFQTLLLGVGAILLAVLVWEFANRSSTPIIDTDVDETVRMVNPRYIGRTSDGLPYTLTAGEAGRVRGRPNELNLSLPLLNFYRLKGVEASTIDAATGIYNDVDQLLELRADPDREVILTTDDGNQCFTTHARIYLDTKLVEGDEPIRCTGDFGVVTGNAYEIRDNYKTFVFKEGMTGLLEADEAEGDAELMIREEEL